MGVCIMHRRDKIIHLASHKFWIDFFLKRMTSRLTSFCYYISPWKLKPTNRPAPLGSCWPLWLLRNQLFIYDDRLKLHRLFLITQGHKFFVKEGTIVYGVTNTQTTNFTRNNRKRERERVSYLVSVLMAPQRWPFLSLYSWLTLKKIIGHILYMYKIVVSASNFIQLLKL